ncbi:MAG: MFS transporter [Candidatus Hodarchaeota archaeon]
MKQKQEQEKTKYPQLTPLWLAVFADILGFTLVIPLIPRIREVFGATYFQSSLLLTLNAIFGFIAGPIFGRLSDKYGRRPMLLIAQAGTFTAFLMFAFSRNLWMLYISRIVDGCFGGNYPLAKAMISDIVLPKDRSVQMTNVGVAHNLANIFGPAVSGVLSEIGYRTLNSAVIFPGLLGAGLSSLTMILTLSRIKETAPSKTGKTVFGDVEYLKKQLEKEEHSSRSLLKNKTALLLLIQWGFHSLSFFTFMSNIGQFAYDTLDSINDPSQLGLLLSITGISQIIIRYTLFYPMLRRIGEKRTATIGLTLFLFVFSLVGFVQVEWQFILILLGLSFAASSVRGVLTGFLSRSVDPRDQGTIQGYNTSLDTFAQIVGPLTSATVLTIFPLHLYGLFATIFAIIPFLIVFKPIEFKYEKKFLQERKKPENMSSGND